MKLLRHITDMDLIGKDGFSFAPPRRAVRATIFDSEGRIALMYVESMSLYTLPGGGMEKGEDVMTSLLREMAEETGCACEITGELGYTIENRFRQDFTQHSFYFHGKVDGDKGIPNFTEVEISDGTSVGWYSLGKVKELVVDKKYEDYQCRFIQARDCAALEALDEILQNNIISMESLVI